MVLVIGCTSARSLFVPAFAQGFGGSAEVSRRFPSNEGGRALASLLHQRPRGPTPTAGPFADKRLRDS